MTLWQNVLTLIILFALFVLIYTKIRNKSIKEALEEIMEIFKLEDKTK